MRQHENRSACKHSERISTTLGCSSGERISATKFLTLLRCSKIGNLTLAACQKSGFFAAVNGRRSAAARLRGEAPPPSGAELLTPRLLSVDPFSRDRVGKPRIDMFWQ